MIDSTTGEVKVRTRLPLRRRASVVVQDPDGRAIVLNVLWMTRGRWARRSESLPGSGWAAWPIGCFVFGFRVDF